MKLSYQKLLNPIRNVLPYQVKQRVKIFLGMPESRLHENWSILQSIGPVTRDHIVIDIGSHHGWFFHCWKDWCPQAEIHAFEPRVEAAQTSIDLYSNDSDLVVNNVAVGDRAGEYEFNVLEGSKVSSSFLEHDQKAWDAIGFSGGEIIKRKVPVITIDEYCLEKRIESIFLMKIDVQGFEMRVLRGAKETLKYVDHILVESGIKKLYHNAPLFTEVVDFLTEQGFHLMTLRAWHRGNHALVETDMLFRRDDLTPQIDNTHDRYCLELKPTD